MYYVSAHTAWVRIINTMIMFEMKQTTINHSIV